MCALLFFERLSAARQCAQTLDGQVLSLARDYTSGDAAVPGGAAVFEQSTTATLHLEFVRPDEPGRPAVIQLPKINATLLARGGVQEQQQSHLHQQSQQHQQQQFAFDPYAAAASYPSQSQYSLGVGAGYASASSQWSSQQPMFA